jgi:hypothetical protein
VEIFWIETILGLQLVRLSLYFYELVRIIEWEEKNGEGGEER